MNTESKLVKSQYKNFEKDIMLGDKEGKIITTIRYDDECGNKHNSFAITGTIYSSRNSTLDRYFETGGCIHNKIIEHFPEFAHLIKWHLCNSDAPMHYVANTTYHARDREYKGKEIGEAVAWNVQLKFEGYPFIFKEPRSGFFKYLQSVDNWESVEILELLHLDK